MTEHDFAAITLILSISCLAATVLGYREGNERRDVRLMAGSSAALGAVALALFTLTRV